MTADELDHLIIPAPKGQPAPRALLCWEQDPRTMTRCDRVHGHQGKHSWELSPCPNPA